MQVLAFGRYQLLGLIGSGGMGKVYKAHDNELDRDVAIKVLPTELGDLEYRKRFRREALVVARLNEPHIIPIHDSGEIDGQLYLVMPIIDGVDVQELLRRDGPMSPQRAVLLIEQLAAALDAAHQAGLVHRDVKPANALLTKQDFAYLIDFGIAQEDAATRMTSTGKFVGTFAYMAPERFNGIADARSDIYSLTCVLHECLTGARPFPGRSIEEQITGHRFTAPPKPSHVNPAVPSHFDEVIARGMAKDPIRRYQSASDLAFAARLALAGTGPGGYRMPATAVGSAAPLVETDARAFAPVAPVALPRPPGSWPPVDMRKSAPVREPTNRRLIWIPIVAALVVLAVATAGYVLWPREAPVKPAPPTESGADAASNQVKSFYKAYLAARHVRPGPPISSWVDQGYLTQSAADSVSAVVGEDLITCSQTPGSFSQYSFSVPEVSGNTASMRVNPVDGAFPGTKTIEMDIGLIKANELWKIDFFACVFRDSRPPSSEPAIPPTATAPAPPPDDPAIQNAMSFYEGYTTAFLSNRAVSLDEWVSQGLITQSAENAIQAASGFDLVTCSPHPVEFSNYRFSTADNGGEPGTQVAVDDSNTHRVISLGQVQEDGKWKINAFACNTTIWR